MFELIASLASIDRSVFLFINQSLANPVTDFLMPLVTLDLHLKIFYGTILLIILWKGDKRLRISIIFSLIVVALSDQACSTFLKPMIGRLRPCWEMDVNLLVGCGTGFAMPSSHAANLFGQAYFYRAVAPSSVKYLIPLAVVVALSRVFVGVHYPADIIVGAALGTLIGFGVGIVFARFFPSENVKQINHEPEQSDKS
jgi:membrane-associated phospholipid phosphatase